jgi:uncharacterized protein
MPCPYEKNRLASAIRRHANNRKDFPMKYAETSDGYMLRFEKGEEIMAGLSAFISEKKIPSGSLWGIGAITDITLGYFSSHEKKYYKQAFNDEYELLSLSGNISYLNDTPMVHAHIVVSKTDYSLLGGHCFSAKVAITVEIYIHKFDKVFHRAMDPEVGLNLLQF